MRKRVKMKTKPRRLSAPLVRETFLTALSEGYGICGACEVAGIGRSSFYRTLDSDTKFASEIRTARAIFENKNREYWYDLINQRISR
jgi:transposase-like protein